MVTGVLCAAAGWRYPGDPLAAAPPGRWAERSGSPPCRSERGRLGEWSAGDRRAARRRRALDPIEPSSAASGVNPGGLTLLHVAKNGPAASATRYSRLVSIVVS